MRELLLVRKLEEENAKKNKLENTSPKNSNTSIEGHHETTDYSANNTTKNITDTNQTFDREDQKNINTNDIDHNVKTITPGDNINSTNQLDTSEVDKILVQISSEHTPSTSDNNSNESMSELSINEKTDGQNLQPVIENAPVNSNHDEQDLKDQMLEEEKKFHEATSLALQTKRESLKEFFLQKLPYTHKDTFTDNQIELDSNFIDDNKSVSLTSSIKDETIKEEFINGNPSQESSGIIKPVIVKDSTSTDKQLTSPTIKLELSPDEKRQNGYENRSNQRMDSKLQKQNINQDIKQNLDETADIIIMGSEKVESLETKNVEENTINIEISALNGESKIESKGEIKSSIHLTRSKNKTSVDTDSDCSVDLDALIAEGSDLESGEIQLNDDGLDDGDDDFWKIDPAEFEKHLTPSTSPLRRPSPDPHGTPTLSPLVNVTGPIAEDDENLSDTPLEVDGQEADDIMNSFSNSNGFDMDSKGAEYDDETNEIDMSLDTQITPILKPISPSPAPSPAPTLSGGKSGIPSGLPKTAFSAHFGPSPLSPTSSRASSVGDPDECETTSNGSYTSVRSASSAKSGASGIRRPSTVTGLRSPSRIGSRIATPGRVDSHSSIPTSQRPRSSSALSDSSTEESTTSSVGATSPSRIASPTRGLHMSMYNMTQSMPGSARPRSMSRVSNSSAESHIASPGSRPLSRAGSVTPKSSNTGPQSRIRSSMSPSNVNATNSKYGTLNSGTVRPSSRASIAKTSPTSTTSIRPLSRLGSFSEPPNTSLKKPRPQSIAVGNNSPNNTATMSRSNSISTTSAYSNTNSGIRCLSSVLKTPSSFAHYGGRSTDSLSSHDEYSSPIFSPPESPTASETDSLTSLASSVSCGSSPGRGTSPIPPHNTSMLATPTTRLSKHGSRMSMTAAPSGISKLPSSRMLSSKLATASGHVTGLKSPESRAKKT
ncbi:12352_t:CDS:2 [Funneliformis caledonium]|uniref:12352_t:CDS:1 n=1 Tax=Funneliformis caledonium TaxID=1117310 RepID=A0A9N9BP78_9GLOM|nr:12352_t:CDS:2 [Funneliformis caledonium]